MSTATLVVTGSEAAAACGVDPYRSPVSLWAEKLGLAPAREPGEAAYWGTLLEPIVKDEVARRDYLIVDRADNESDEVRSDEYPWLLGHIDGRVARESSPRSDWGILEVKTTSPWRGHEWEDDQAPPAVVVQAHVYMLLTGLSWALAACLVGGQRLELREFAFDPGIAEIVAAKTQEFLGFVERQEPPPPDGARDTTELLGRLYPYATPAVIELTPEEFQVCRRREALREQLKEVERQKDECDQVLKLALGEASVGMWEGRRVVTWAKVDRAGYEVEARSYRQLRVRP